MKVGNVKNNQTRGNDYSGFGETIKKPKTVGETDAKAYTRQIIGLPPGETMCPRGELFRGNAHMGGKEERGDEEMDIRKLGYGRSVGKRI